MTALRTAPLPTDGQAPVGRRRNRHDGLGRGMLAVIGVVATAVIVVAGTLLVASGSGSLSRDPEVTAVLPAEAGPIFGSAGVQYQGVHVGSLVGLDAGVTRSRLTMQIRADKIREIPASVKMRVVPRTLFGDVFLDLVAPENPAIGPRLTDGSEVAVDTSAEAAQLSNLYYRSAALLAELRPDQLATALDAMSQALQGRGATLGRTIDRMAALSEDLGPLVEAGLAASPQVAGVTESMSAATDDVVAVMRNASELSEIVLAREDGIGRLLAGGAALSVEGAGVLDANTDNTIAIVRNGAPVIGAFAGDTAGLDETLRYLSIFGEAGGRVFSTGRFNITAVADPADPMPYTSADCPRYPGLDGSNCGDPVRTSSVERQPILAAAERQPLGFLEQIAGGADPADPAATRFDPSTAASILLAPLVRGTAVSIP
ncbi:MCE family protein [Rhodococcus chondri]|uniref:MCE family protein n=1 Tax=Rhodococcus chondri TaxID=3065941 RepID=A0ABU7JLY7_9NOCA|nr:MCE family protein [Rhodococcus sp. CC-R104]MEE2030820.1 MCE family protein [Rhodococcus sp. CC-R104]